MSHVKRLKRNGTTFEECGPKFWRQWQRMCELDAFRFPIETRPFDDLSEFIGRKIKSNNAVYASIGNYPEKEDIQLAKRTLGDLWRYVEMALDTEDGQIYSLTEF